MAEVDNDVGRKRRLPVWMLGVTAADHIRKSEDGDESIPLEKAELASHARQPKAKAIAKRLLNEVLLNDNAPLEVDSSFMAKCETKRGKGQSSRQDVDHDGAIHSESGGVEKKRANNRSDGVGRKVQEPPLRKKQKAKSNRVASIKEIKIPSPTEEDEELTIEDLMSIAEEYVNADKDMERLPEKKEPGSKTQLASTVLSINELGGSLKATQSNGTIPTRTTTSTYNFTETGWKDLESSASEGVIINTSRTGDPAQDMLNLFLGPLLKKPRSEEKKLDFITEDMTLAYKFKKQSQNDAAGEDVVPLMKKKSSLKDKVAMFLD